LVVSRLIYRQANPELARSIAQSSTRYRLDAWNYTSLTRRHFGRPRALLHQVTHRVHRGRASRFSRWSTQNMTMQTSGSCQRS